jgi:hypothetical protein
MNHHTPLRTYGFIHLYSLSFINNEGLLEILKSCQQNYQIIKSESIVVKQPSLVWQPLKAIKSFRMRLEAVSFKPEMQYK